MYGDCYDKVLTEECVCMDSECRGGTWKLALRLVALALVVTNLIFAILFFDPIALLIFFTNWNMEFTLALVVIVIWCSFDKDINQKKGWLSAMHILTEISFISNFLTVSVYWSVLHKVAIEKFKEDDLKVLHMYLVHSFPTLALMIVLATTDIQMKPSHGKAFLPFGFFYAVANYIATKKRGAPLYHILTWEDYKSPLLCFVLTLSCTAIYMFFAQLSIKLNQSKKAKAKVN